MEDTASVDLSQIYFILHIVSSSVLEPMVPISLYLTETIEKLKFIIMGKYC